MRARTKEVAVGMERRDPQLYDLERYLGSGLEMTSHSEGYAEEGVR